MKTIEKTCVTRDFFIMNQKTRFTSIQHITHLPILGRLSSLSLLNDILKESEIQEEVQTNKVFIVYVIDFIRFFLKKSQMVPQICNVVNRLLNQNVDPFCSTIHYENIYFTRKLVSHSFYISRGNRYSYLAIKQHTPNSPFT